MSTTVGKTTAASKIASSGSNEVSIPPRLLKNLNEAAKAGHLEVSIKNVFKPGEVRPKDEELVNAPSLYFSEAVKQSEIQGTLTILAGEDKGHYPFEFKFTIWGGSSIEIDQSLRIQEVGSVYREKVDSDKYPALESLLTKKTWNALGVATE